MKVKCRYCEDKVEKEVAFLYVHETKTGNKQNQWYCCKEHYETEIREKDLYRKIQYETDAILGRPITNNARNKEIKELNESGYSYEEIFRCVRAKADDIRMMIEKNSIQGDYQQIRYMCQVIKNCIYDFTKEDKKANDWSKYVPREEEVEIIFEEEETDDDIRNRLKNQKERNTIEDFLKGLR